MLWSIKSYQQRFFDSQGRSQPVTVLKLLPAMVVGFRRQEKDGYEAVILGLGERKLERMKKPQREWLKKQGIKKGFRLIKEVRLEGDQGEKQLQIGQEIDLWSDLKVGSLTKMSGVMKGRGFTGVVKRWGFAGGPRTHGQSDRERAPGSIGAGTTPGRVVKGKKMAGHYGHQLKTVLNLPVLAIDKENKLVLVKGLLPGPKGGIVRMEIVGTKEVAPIELSKKEEKEDENG